MIPMQHIVLKKMQDIGQYISIKMVDQKDPFCYTVTVVVNRRQKCFGIL